MSSTGRVSASSATSPANERFPVLLWGAADLIQLLQRARAGHYTVCPAVLFTLLASSIALTYGASDEESRDTFIWVMSDGGTC
jgi:hypothetical protein